MTGRDGPVIFHASPLFMGYARSAHLGTFECPWPLLCAPFLAGCFLAFACAHA